MKFDVVISNPPYQKDNGALMPKEMYSGFIKTAYEVADKCSILITPTRWFNGVSDNMQEVRNLLLNKHTLKIVDYQCDKDVFIDTHISGGICYYLNSKKRESEECEVKHIENKKTTVFKIKLHSDIFLRFKEAESILQKVKDRKEITIDMTYGFWETCKGVHLDDAYDKEKSDRNYLRYINKDRLISYKDDSGLSGKLLDNIGKYKVLVGGMTPGGGVQQNCSYAVITMIRIKEPYEIFSDFYYAIGYFDTLEEAKNFKSYMSTKFARFLIQLLNNTTSLRAGKFKFVPVQDYSHAWTDEMLYEKYNISNEEIACIERIIKNLSELDNQDYKNSLDKFSNYMNKPEEQEEV